MNETSLTGDLKLFAEEHGKLASTLSESMQRIMADFPKYILGMVIAYENMQEEDFFKINCHLLMFGMAHECPEDFSVMAGFWRKNSERFIDAVTEHMKDRIHDDE